MQKKWSEYQLILFDMDGTLYFQRPLQVHMGIKMLLSCLKPGGFHEIMIVLRFRKLRENWKSSSATTMLLNSNIDETQYQLLSTQMGLTPDEIRPIIQKWIYQLPLQLLTHYRDNQLIEILKKYHLYTQVVIYSDYPATEKCIALGLNNIPCFYGGQENISRLKPDPKGIQVIMNHYHITDPSMVLMIGDRFSKDGQAAIAAGVDYLILKKHRIQRNKQYNILLPK